jgi:hypothetical protein
LTRLDLDVVAPEAMPGIRILPVLHERVDLAHVVRLTLEQLQPEAVAVELPTTLGVEARQAVKRLPRISLVVSEEPGEEALVWVVTPGDPLVEGMRWAAENDREILLVDPDLRYHHRRRDSLPDPQALHTLGIETYVQLIRQLASEAPHDERDSLRERGMAHELRTASERINGTVLCLTGAAHAERLAEAITASTTPVLARQHRKRVLLRHLHPESLTALLPDPPIAHAAYEHLRSAQLPPLPSFRSVVSERLELSHGPLTVIAGHDSDGRDERMHAVSVYVAHRCRTDAEPPAIDRAALAREVWRIGAASYKEQTRTEVERWQRRLYFDFIRRYTRLRGQLAPGIYEWVVGARGVGDDNLAWEVFEVGRCYPWQEEQAEITTASIDGEMLDLGTRTVRFRRRFFRVKQKPLAVPVRHRPKPGEPREWLQAFSGDSICSYPPEDIAVEDWGRHLKERALSILSAEHARSEPFSTSMLDGLDIRETLLRHHEGRIWVREQGREAGAAGSVVVIFDADRSGSGYPYMMTWLGEHEQESDMALYATDPLQQVVGPGIMRATYGGFMLTYPPGRLYDVWRDSDYQSARSKPEVLTMAAVDYSTDKLVVHVAAKPPSSRMREFASRQGKRLLHLPLGSLSPAGLKTLRVVHILSGRDKREIAKDYIW